MSFRALFLADGSSDLPIADHLLYLCRQAGLDVQMITPFPGSILAVGHTVEARLRQVLRQDASFELIFVHRDAENQPPERRFAEVREAVASVNFLGPSVAVVPIRMTEAWLLLDEPAIRIVAGKPHGSAPLNLPPLRQVESTSDPKRLLQEALVIASETSGRRLKDFRRRFDEQRRQLLGMLDPAGPVSDLRAWRQVATEIEMAAVHLAAAD